MKLDDLIVDGNRFSGVGQGCPERWPAIPDVVTVVLIGPGSKIAVGVGCCQRGFVDMVRFVDDDGQTIGFAGYSHKADSLVARLYESPGQTLSLKGFKR